MTRTCEDWIQAGTRHLKRRDFEPAAKAFKRALVLGDLPPNSHAQFGHCLEKLGDLPGSLKHWRLAVNSADCQPGWHAKLARVLVEAGDRDGAEAHFKTEWDSNPSEELALEMGVLGWKHGLSALARDVPGAAASLIARLDAATRSRGAEAESEELAMIRALSENAAQPVSFWLYLFARLMTFGRAVAALEAKRIAARIIVQQATMSVPETHDELENAIAAACYLDAFKEAGEIIARFRSANPTSNKWRDRRYEFDVLLCRGRVGEARTLLQEIEFSNLVTDYRALLAGKTCALVGPAENKLSNGERIDAHDLVIRTNFGGAAPIDANASMVGRRSDIVYYNAPFVDLYTTQVLNALKDAPPKFVVTRTERSQRQLKKQLPELRVRPWLSYKKQAFVGIGFAMRHLLFELVLLADRAIDVFGADFYLGEKPHYAGYFDEGIVVTNSLAKHDPFDTFMFMRALYKNGAITADKILADILELPLETFAARLSQRFNTA